MKHTQNMWPLNTKPEHDQAKHKNSNDYTNETRKRQLSGQTLKVLFLLGGRVGDKGFVGQCCGYLTLPHTHTHTPVLSVHCPMGSRVLPFGRSKIYTLLCCCMGSSLVDSKASSTPEPVVAQGTLSAFVPLQVSLPPESSPAHSAFH